MLKWPKHQFNTGTITAVDVPTMSDDVGSVFSERVLVSFPDFSEGGLGTRLRECRELEESLGALCVIRSEQIKIKGMHLCKRAHMRIVWIYGKPSVSKLR